VREIKLKRRAWHTIAPGWSRCIIELELPTELLQSCEPNSLYALDVMAVDALCMSTAQVTTDFLEQPIVKVSALCSRSARKPSAMILRLRGVRRGHATVWPRYTADEAARNELFYGSATLLSPIQPETNPLPHEAN
jgi:hypothetical protein